MWNRLIYLATIALLFTVVPVLAQSQQHDATNPGQMVVQGPGESSTQVVHPLPPSPRHFYRLDFVLREMDDGKPLNQRTFTMSVSADPADTRERTWWNLRAGTRLPVRDPNGTNYVGGCEPRHHRSRRGERTAVGSHGGDFFGRHRGGLEYGAADPPAQGERCGLRPARQANARLHGGRSCQPASV